MSDYFSQFAQPSTGDQFWVRYDPDDKSKVEIDTAKIAASNAALEAQATAAAASAVPLTLRPTAFSVAARSSTSSRPQPDHWWIAPSQLAFASSTAPTRTGPAATSC